MCQHFSFQIRKFNKLAKTDYPIMMTQEEYLKERVEDQISWYDKKSGNNKRWFHKVSLGV